MQSFQCFYSLVSFGCMVVRSLSAWEWLEGLSVSVFLLHDLLILLASGILSVDLMDS